MAQREQRRGKRGTAASAAAALAANSAAAPEDKLGAQLAALERERDALKRELEQAKSRVSELETAHAQVLNRIDWAIDSLHNLLEGGG